MIFPVYGVVVLHTPPQRCFSHRRRLESSTVTTRCSMTTYMGHQSDCLDFFCSIRFGVRLNEITLSPSLMLNHLFILTLVHVVKHAGN